MIWVVLALAGVIYSALQGSLVGEMFFVVLMVVFAARRPR